MAEPSGPTVARTPDETDSPQPSEDPSPAADAETATPASAPVSDEVGGAGEKPASTDAGAGGSPSGATVDDTGTVAAGAAAGEGDEVPASVVVDDTEAPAADDPAPAGAAAAGATTITLPSGGRQPHEAGGPGGDGDVPDATGSDDGDGGDTDPDAEDGLVEDEADVAEPRRRGGFLTKQVQVDARLILIITAVFALMVGAFFYGRNQARQTAAPRETRTPSSTVPGVPKDFVPLEDKATGVKLSVPQDWVQYSTKDLDPAIRLAVGVPDTNDTVVVRVNSFSSEVTAANVGDQKNVFDQLLAAEKIEILVNQAQNLGNLPALFYVYRFTDAATGIKGYHAHYFIFQGRKMVSVIFQALPEARYAVLAPVFDQIASTIEIAPGPPPDFLNPIGGGATTAPGPETSAPTSAPAPPTTG